MSKEIGIEEYGEASARVVGKLVACVFRILWAIVGGLLTGLCLLPFLRGVKKAIAFEVTRAREETS